MSWETVIGLEVHAQVASAAKLFSDAPTAYGATPNSQVSLVDAAMPGMLPVLNKACVAAAIKTGLGLNAKINLVSEFARKNYFYPDLPPGYQISQYAKPIVGEGWLEIEADGATRKIGIERLHLEQDAGKLLHDKSPSASMVDLNRAGVALMEIVSKPDLRSAEEAKDYLRKLRALVRQLGTCDGNMEEGSLRADVNVSVRRAGEALGTRCEIKNVNSFRFVGMAIEHEVRRQIGVLEAGGAIQQETRLFDPASGETRPMRSKEEAEDYRYFPDPDLPPLVIEQAWINALQSEMPELPAAREARLREQMGLSEYDARVLVQDSARADYFEELAKGRNPKKAANWVLGDLAGSLNKAKLGFTESPVPPARLGELLDLLESGEIKGQQAKIIWGRMFESGRRAGEIIAEGGIETLYDKIAEILYLKKKSNPEQFENMWEYVLEWLENASDEERAEIAERSKAQISALFEKMQKKDKSQDEK